MLLSVLVSYRVKLLMSCASIAVRGNHQTLVSLKLQLNRSGIDILPLFVQAVVKFCKQTQFGDLSVVGRGLNLLNDNKYWNVLLRIMDHVGSFYLLLVQVQHGANAIPPDAGSSADNDKASSLK